MSIYKMKNSSLVELIFSVGLSKSSLVDILCAHILQSFSIDYEEFIEKEKSKSVILNEFIRVFVKNFKVMFRKCSYKKESFQEKKKKWLDETLLYHQK